MLGAIDTKKYYNSNNQNKEDETNKIEQKIQKWALQGKKNEGRETALKIIKDAKKNTDKIKPIIYQTDNGDILIHCCRKLDLSDLCLTNLPKELSKYLPETNFLILKNNCFKKTPMICHFKNLEFLDISNNPIKKIPRGLPKLPKLKILNINNCEKISALPKDFINMAQLEMLSMVNLKNIKELPKNFFYGLLNLKAFYRGENCSWNITIPITETKQWDKTIRVAKRKPPTGGITQTFKDDQLSSDIIAPIINIVGSLYSGLKRPQKNHSRTGGSVPQPLSKAESVESPLPSGSLIPPHKLQHTPPEFIADINQHPLYIEQQRKSAEVNSSSVQSFSTEKSLEHSSPSPKTPDQQDNPPPPPPEKRVVSGPSATDEMSKNQDLFEDNPGKIIADSVTWTDNHTLKGHPSEASDFNYNFEGITLSSSYCR